MVRKQLYLQAEQDEQLKAMARTTGRSEAQVVRDALDGLAGAARANLRPDAAAWAEALAFMRSRRSSPARPAGARVTRETLYREMTRRGRRAR
jgi:hypothetical protein